MAAGFGRSVLGLIYGFFRHSGAAAGGNGVRHCAMQARRDLTVTMTARRDLGVAMQARLDLDTATTVE